MAHRAVELGGLAVGESVMVRGVELAAAVVVLDQIASESEDILEVLEHLKAAAIGGCRWGSEVGAPYTATPGSVSHINGRCQVHALAGATLGVEHFYLFVGGVGGRCRQVIDLLAVLICREHGEYVGFLLCC